MLEEFIRLTGCRRKSAIRLLNAKLLREILIYGNWEGGGGVKVKPAQKQPANRKGKRVYTDEVIAALRPIWAFFWYKCGKILAPFLRRQMAYIARRPTFHITHEIAEKFARISPATIDRRLKKDRDALRLKGKSPTKPRNSLKSRIPIRAFYSGEEREPPVSGKLTRSAAADKPPG
ncbi:MAG: hypothetical protein LBC53_09585 [Spirochaetaceae bacterium]|jgi:hypothetical protein|nr:hypothetical protein [Spirochaetaceae bacterium]